MYSILGVDVLPLSLKNLLLSRHNVNYNSSFSKRQKSNVVKSPLSVFKHLSRSRNLPTASTASAGPVTSQSEKHNQPQPPQNPAPPSIAPSEAAGPCESPYPVSNCYMNSVRKPKVVQLISY